MVANAEQEALHHYFSFRGRAWTIQHWCSKHAWVFHQNLPPQLISAAGSELFSGMIVAVLASRCRATVTWLACERFGLLCYGKDSCPESLDCCDLSFWPAMQVRCSRIGGCTRAKCSDVYGSSRGVVRAVAGLAFPRTISTTSHGIAQSTRPSCSGTSTWASSRSQERV